ncbi:MAG TPA: hypothetical protein VIJ95_08215 [Hanamia sp.]
MTRVKNARLFKQTEKNRNPVLLSIYGKSAFNTMFEGAENWIFDFYLHICPHNLFSPLSMQGWLAAKIYVQRFLNKKEDVLFCIF